MTWLTYLARLLLAFLAASTVVEFFLGIIPGAEETDYLRFTQATILVAGLVFCFELLCERRRAFQAIIISLSFLAAIPPGEVLVSHATSMENLLLSWLIAAAIAITLLVLALKR